MSEKTVTLPENSFFTLPEMVQMRNDTAGTKHVIHLNNAGAGLMPDIVTKAQLDHILLESQIGGYEASAIRADMIRGFYEQCAILLNCKPSNIAFTASATDSFSRALSSIPFQKGDVILTDRDDFVSNQIQFLSLQKKLGVEIIHINNAAEGGVDLNDLRTKLNKHTPRLLAITHMPTNSGLVQPVNEIASIYQDYLKVYPDKSWYILDACQSIGQMKLDVQQLKCDFMSATCRKFLRGPRGTGVLFIADRVLQTGLEPLFIDMRGAEWKEKDRYQAQPDARRFEDWEFAYASIVGTKAAIEYCLHIGEDKIERQVRLLAGIARQKLASLDKVKVLDRGPQLSGLVTFYAEGGDPEYIVSELLKRRINVVPSYRAYGLIDFDEKGVQWAVRVSPHYYNTLDEIEAFIESIREII
jgi:selenocysteine lyase/cysteine desulfurase